MDAENNQDMMIAQANKALDAARAALPADDFGMDADLVEIFTDEAVEVLQSLDIILPKWLNNPADLAILTEVREEFCTIKVSARMVGANTVGEMAWAIENLLNHLLDGSLGVVSDMVDFVSRAKLDIAYAVADFTCKQPASVDPAITIVTANSFWADVINVDEQQIDDMDEGFEIGCDFDSDSDSGFDSATDSDSIGSSNNFQSFGKAATSDANDAKNDHSTQEQAVIVDSPFADKKSSKTIPIIIGVVIFIVLLWLIF